jgi:23S rRNA (cytidine1920-2'-O)/16S rRNA (cytidine1409-2'-O)-methyltransferase
MRADVLLVERGLAASRTAAQRLIAGGHVFARMGNARVSLAKPSLNLDDDVELEIAANELERFVSRGGLKLEGALKHAGLTVADLVCLDVGQSTGGFTDCLLQRGARHVVGVDVGHDQLHPTLRRHSRVTAIEGINARELSVQVFAAHRTSFSAFDVIVADVSFISLAKVLPQWPRLLNESGRVLSLVKPQFEVGAENLGKGGIVRDQSLYSEVERSIRATCVTAGLQVLDFFASVIEGGDGNREFFVYAKRAG